MQAGDKNQELLLLDKLLASIQQVLQDSDAQVTPRTAAVKLSVGELCPVSL